MPVMNRAGDVPVTARVVKNGGIRTPRGTGGNRLERVTVNLVTRTSRALQRVSELTGDSRTDCINRAIQIYDYLEEVDSHGGAIYVRESKDSELQRLKMFLRS